MYEISGELRAILITVRWLQNLEKKMAVGKQATQKFDAERFNLRKLNEQLEVRKQFQIKISNRFCSFGELK